MRELSCLRGHSEALLIGPERMWSPECRAGTCGTPRVLRLFAVPPC
jgi:hypothetical protein